jgi:ferrous iron transport protein A
MQKTCDFAGCTNVSGNVSACPLSAVGVGCQAKVVAVGGDTEVRRRLLEMGFCNGASIEVIRRAPLGDPIEFRLRGYHLSLRDEQAQFVQVHVASGAAK